MLYSSLWTQGLGKCLALKELVEMRQWISQSQTYIPCVTLVAKCVGLKPELLWYKTQLSRLLAL